MSGMKVRWDMWGNEDKFDDEVFEEGKNTTSEAEKDEIMDRQSYNMEKQKLSFLGSRATDSHLNTFIHLPKAAPLKKETTIQMVKERLASVAKEFGNDADLTPLHSI